MNPFLRPALIPAIAAALALQAEELKVGNNAAAQPRSAAEQQRSFVLPQGFSIELVASEETGVPKPVSIAFDDSGRLWAVTATGYPRDNEPDIWNRPGQDRVVVIDRPLGPGPHTARTFADGMVIPMSVLPHRNGALVAQGPEILFLSDDDGDGRADSRRVLVSGFGVQDTHTMPHQLERVPGNWVAFSQGVLNTGTAVTASGKRVNFDRTVVARMRPDGSDLVITGTGLNNIWAWAQARNGRVFFHEANDFGYGIVPFEEDTTYPSFIKRLVHPDSPYHPPTTPNLTLGGTGFSGLAIADDREGTFPAPWQGMFFVANPITRRINAVTARLGQDGVHHFTQQPDLVSTDDEFFRPIAVRFGPDGCLYIVDWYNRIISHNEIARDHPARDKTRGRIWRVRHTSQNRRTAPDVAAAPQAQLLRHLQSASTWEMRAAWHQIAARDARDLIPALVSLASQTQTPNDVRIHVIWCLEELGHFDAPLWRTLVSHADADVRHEAVRALGTLNPPMSVLFPLLETRASEPSFRVRWEVIRRLRDRADQLSEDQLAWLNRWRTQPDLKNTVKGWDRDYLAPGGTYESVFQNLLIQMAGERYRGTVPAPVSSRWTGSIARVPARSADETARINDRLRQLITQVDSTKQFNAAEGRARFEATCAVCHPTGRGGGGFAPSLAGSRNRSTEAILTSILDPARAVEGAFRVFRVETSDGETTDGFFGDEAAEALTLRFPGTPSRSIPVKSIRKAGYVDGSSMMPEGLLNGMTDSQIIDLVRHVQSLE